MGLLLFLAVLLPQAARGEAEIGAVPLDKLIPQEKHQSWDQLIAPQLRVRDLQNEEKQKIAKQAEEVRLPQIVPVVKATPVVVPSGSAVLAYAQSRVAADQWSCLYNLWEKESGWNPYSVNRYSGAYGIPQALGHGNVFALGDYVTQINWGLAYISGKYGTPCAAWGHSQATNWY